MSGNSLFKRGMKTLVHMAKAQQTAQPASAAASVAPGSGRKVSVAGSGMKRRRMSTTSYGSGVSIPK